MAVNPDNREQLQCMYCPFDMPVPPGSKFIRGGSLDGRRDIVKVKL